MIKSFTNYLIVLYATVLLISGCVNDDPKKNEFAFVYDSSLMVKGIPCPSLPQLRWQNYERIMFVHFNPTTWTGKEYDDLSFPLSKINPSLLNTDQWCEVAKSWGAKMILFVAKHTGGFCWWQTETSEYGVRNIPWKNGKGDVLAELTKSCKRYGLDLGIYIYPGDEKWGAGIGSGGKTNDPLKQEEYNQIFRQQLVEVLTRYGSIREVWFDGSCVINVSDIIKKYASNAVIFQGPNATIRWVGNEDGIAPYPNWYTLKKEDLETGVSTALASDPDGDVYAPVEVDLPLLANKGHKWFWAPNTDTMILTPDQLMDIYYQTVGRGAIMLLNSTPDTSGLIPESHVKVYKAFGDEIKKRFNNPIATTKGFGDVYEITFEKPMPVNHAVIQEEIAYGQRVREYILEGFNSDRWFDLYTGSSIGTKKIDVFDSILVTKIRLRIRKAAAPPIIKSFSVFFIKNMNEFHQISKLKPIVIGSWDATSFTNEWSGLELDLTPYLDFVGQYEINFQQVSYDWTKDWGLEFRNWEVEMYNKIMPQAIQKVGNNSKFIITRSQQTETQNQFPTRFRVDVRSKPGKTVGVIELTKVKFQ